jgi:Bacterial hydrolase
MSSERPLTTYTQSMPRPSIPSTGCCPPFDPATYEDREVTWKDKLFVKEHVHSVLHMPLDIGTKMRKAMRKINAAGANPAQSLTLSDELSPWRSDLYLDVTRDVPGAEMARLSGTFLTHVYEGPYRDAPKWYADMVDRVRARGETPKKVYFGYTTCPACAKAYGKNYVVLFAEVRPSGDISREP